MACITDQDQLVRKYKNTEQRCVQFMQKLFPNITLDLIMDRRARFYDGELTDEKNCQHYVRYLRHHWFLLKEASAFREEYYQLQLKLGQTEDNGHSVARELTQWLVTDAQTKLTAFIEQYTENNQQAESVWIADTENIPPEENIKPQASLKKENKKRKKWVRKKRAQEEEILRRAIKDNEKLLSDKEFMVDENVPINMSSLALLVLTKYIPREYLAECGFNNPMFLQVISRTNTFHMIDISQGINMAYENPVYGCVGKPLSKDMLYYTNILVELYKWCTSMRETREKYKNKFRDTIDSFVKKYKSKYINNEEIRKRWQLCSKDCIVCAINYHYCHIKGGKNIIPPCTEICKRSLYYITYKNAICQLDKLNDAKTNDLNNGIYIDDDDHFLCIPRSLHTRKEIHQWLCDITWKSNCVIKRLKPTNMLADLPFHIKILQMWKWIN